MYRRPELVRSNNHISDIRDITQTHTVPSLAPHNKTYNEYNHGKNQGGQGSEVLAQAVSAYTNRDTHGIPTATCNSNTSTCYYFHNPRIVDRGPRLTV